MEHPPDVFVLGRVFYAHKPTSVGRAPLLFFQGNGAGRASTATLCEGGYIDVAAPSLRCAPSPPEVWAEKWEGRMSGFITGVKSVEEVEAGIFEVVVTLQRGATAKLRMNTFTFQAFVTKFIEGPKPERWLDKPIDLLKNIFAPLWHSRKRQ
jgi:hypothetical protein